MKTDHDHSPRVWIFMADSRSSQDLRDLDHLDAILWGSNPNARCGDLVLLYRTAPYKDIPYVFVAGSDPRPTRKQDQADTKYVIELVDKVRLVKPLSLAQIKAHPQLSSWSFAAYQQGAMRRRRDIKEEGVWPALRRALITRSPQLEATLKEIDAPQGQFRRRGLHGSRDRFHSSAKSAGRERRKKRVPLKIFLSYASEDFKQVRRLYRRLRTEPEFEPWFDKFHILAGENWKDAIRLALESCDGAVICLSSLSLRKVGFVRTEIGWALEIANHRPEGTTFIIPVKLEPCKVPKRLSKWQWVDLFETGGHKMLTGSLQNHLSRLQV